MTRREAIGMIGGLTGTLSHYFDAGVIRGCVREVLESDAHWELLEKSMAAIRAGETEANVLRSAGRHEWPGSKKGA